MRASPIRRPARAAGRRMPRPRREHPDPCRGRRSQVRVGPSAHELHARLPDRSHPPRAGDDGDRRGGARRRRGRCARPASPTPDRRRDAGGPGRVPGGSCRGRGAKGGGQSRGRPGIPRVERRERGGRGDAERDSVPHPPRRRGGDALDRRSGGRSLPRPLARRDRVRQLVPTRRAGRVPGRRGDPRVAGGTPGNAGGVSLGGVDPGRARLRGAGKPAGPLVRTRPCTSRSSSSR